MAEDSRLADIEESGVIQTRKNDEKALLDSQVATSPEFESDSHGDGQYEVEDAVPPLIQHIKDGWSSARSAKGSGVRAVLDDCKLKRNSTYSKTELSKITSGSTAFSPITARKCVTAEATIVDMIKAEKAPYDFSATPLPEISEDTIVQITEEVSKNFMARLQEDPSLTPQDAFDQAQIAHMLYSSELHDSEKEAYRRMKKRMDDQLHHGKFVEAFKDFSYDLITYPAGIMKHEIINKKVTSWKDGGLVTEVSPIHSWRRVSPFNFYPSYNMRKVSDGDVFELIQYKRKDLSMLRKNKGYRKKAIEKILDTFGSRGVNSFEDTSSATNISTEATTTQGNNESGNVLFDAIEFWGSVSGELLQGWGVKGIKDKYEEYDITAILIDTEIIKVALNPNKEGNKPFYVASYDPSPDSIWGQGIPQKIKDSQEVSNTIRRNTINNINLSSGPQVVVNTSLLDPKGGSYTTIKPFKVWTMRNTGSNPNASAGDALQFVNVPSVVQQLMGAEEYYGRQADEDSGVTRFAEGNVADTKNSAASTATGATLLNENANRTSRKVMAGVDNGVIKPLIRDLYMFNMMDEKVPDVEKFDADIVAYGSLNVNIKAELSAKREKFLLLILQNYAVLQNSFPPDRLMVLLREMAGNLELPVGELIPTEQEMKGEKDAQLQQAMAQAQEEAKTATINMMIEGGLDKEQAFVMLNKGEFEQQLKQEPQQTQQG